MKANKIILMIVLMLLLFSCEQQRGKENLELKSSEKTQSKADSTEAERLKKRVEIEADDLRDSIRLRNVYNIAWDSVRLNIKDQSLKKEFTVKCDTAFDVSVEISLDYHFTKKHPHLIIRRKNPYVILIDIFSKTDTAFKKVLSHEQWSLTYENDTIRDIDGDGINDYVVNWYGSTGCCLKGFSDVYLLRSDKKEFSKMFEFINPTFSPKKGIVRGICYGHPGETEMYKYKWNGEKVDTLEYIFYEKDKSNKKTGKVIVSNHKPYDHNFRVLKRLNGVPDEYKSIQGYDWFTGF